jgi:hypothetical protein
MKCGINCNLPDQSFGLKQPWRTEADFTDDCVKHLGYKRGIHAEHIAGIWRARSGQRIAQIHYPAQFVRQTAAR